MIRIATSNDACGIFAIYAPIVRGTTISFELEPPTVEEIAQRITATLSKLPWLVIETAGQHLAGYAYASPHRTRLACAQ